MADKQPSNLSGFWTGVYDYPRGLKEPVPFNAVITDTDGVLTGEIIEPNTFSSAMDRELFASLAGKRDGMSVTFVKTYEKVPRGGHSLPYEGTLDSTCNRIEGTWRASPTWFGPFVMNRTTGAKVEKEVKAEKEAELVGTIPR